MRCGDLAQCAIVEPISRVVAGLIEPRVSRRSRNEQRARRFLANQRRPDVPQHSTRTDGASRALGDARPHDHHCRWPERDRRCFSVRSTHHGTDNDHNAHGPKPTIVLVHGGWADASSWDAVAQRLEEDGYTVIAPANPLRGVQSDSAYLSSVLATISGPIVLVGHSYGGVLITNAADRKPERQGTRLRRGVRPRPGRDRRSDLGDEPRQPRPRHPT